MFFYLKITWSKIVVLTLPLLVIATVGCSGDEQLQRDAIVLNHQANSIRTIEEAFETAEQAIQMLDGQAGTRAAQTRTINKEQVRIIGDKRTRSSSSNSSDTLIYIVNYNDNAGFAIISANRGTTALLGVSDCGNYDDAISENKGLALFMDMANAFVGNNPISSPTPPMIEVETTLIANKNPLITVAWGQKFPEGLYCPNTICGCANTAAIQIFSYYESPIFLNLTFPQRERYYILINWTEIKKHYSGGSSYASHTNCLANVNSHKNIGEMARQCAVYAQSVFSYNGIVVPSTDPLPYSYTNYVAWPNAQTGTGISGIVNMIEAMGFVRPYFSYYTSLCTQTDLNLNRPIYMVGHCSEGGHAWVVDGYKYYQDVTTNHATVPETITTSYRYYNHVNWGWYGVANGYFLDGVFATNSAYSYDNSSLGYPNYSFTMGLSYAPIEL